MNNTFTYAGTVLPADKTLDKNELSFLLKPEEFDECVPLFEDGPVMIEHKDHMKCKGTSTKAWKDEKTGDLKVATTVSLDDEYGRMVKDGVKAGKLRGLSFRGTAIRKPGFLKKSTETGLWEVVPPKVVEYTMTEISVCAEGQIPGSDLNAWVEVDAEGKVETGVFDYDTKPKVTPAAAPATAPAIAPPTAPPIAAEVGASKTISENTVCTPLGEANQTSRPIAPMDTAADPTNVNRTLKRERPDGEAQQPPAQQQQSAPADAASDATGAQANKKIKYEVEDAEYRELMAFKKEKAERAEEAKAEAEKKNRDERKRMAEMLKDSMQALMDQYKNDKEKSAALEKDANEFFGKVQDGADLTVKETSLIAAAVSASKTAGVNNINKMQEAWKKEKEDLEKKQKALNDQLLYQISLNPTASRPAAAGKTAQPAAGSNTNWFSSLPGNQVSYGNEGGGMPDNTAVPRFNANEFTGGGEAQTAEVGASASLGSSSSSSSSSTDDQQQQRRPLPAFDHPIFYENESLRYMATNHNQLYRDIRWGQTPSLAVDDMISDRLRQAWQEKQAKA